MSIDQDQAQSKAADEAIEAEHLRQIAETVAHEAGWNGRRWPLRSAVAAFIDRLLDALFPELTGGGPRRAEDLGRDLVALERNLRAILEPLGPELPAPAAEIAASLIGDMEQIHRMLRRDAVAIYEGDPAARSTEEVVIAYPGFSALAFHRIAHQLHHAGVPLIPRIITEIAHERTGIDIHPGAHLGNPIFIDHGTGIVIGETALVGNRVKLYQGVTLGALSVAKELQSVKRHPTIEDDVVIYANATILGGETVIGAGSIVGGNVWLTESLPAGSVVYHRSEVHVRRANGGANHIIDFSI